MNYKIIKNKDLKEYRKKYSNYLNLKTISKIDADNNSSLLNGKTWWLIDEIYYEAPSHKDKIAIWWMHLSKSGQVAICVLSSLAVASAVVVPTTITIINKNKSVVVSSLKLNKSKLDLEVGETFKLVATTEPEGITVSYESSNPNKVSVAKDGTVTANEVVDEDNKVIITAKSGNKTATCEVTTYDIYEIDWATTKFTNAEAGFNNETVYDKACLAEKVEFIKDKESTNGVCVGETKANGQDRVYASFSNDVLKIWSPGKIALDDDDKGDGSEGPGTFSDCNEITSIDFSNIDTHLITDMSYMFCGCNELKTINLTLFDTSNVINMESMFFCCSSLDNVLDLCSFNTSNVKKMRKMFQEADSVKTIYVSNNFKVDKVLSPEGDNGNLMFEGSRALVGGAGSTLNSIKALDNSFYITAKYARIDKGNTIDTAGYFSDKPE